MSVQGFVYAGPCPWFLPLPVRKFARNALIVVEEVVDRCERRGECCAWFALRSASTTMTAPCPLFTFRHFILLCMLIYANINNRLVHAAHYCPLDSESTAADGWPLPVPLPRDAATSAALGSTATSTNGYYECPVNTICCPTNNCCYDELAATTAPTNFNG